MSDCPKCGGSLINFVGDVSCLQFSGEYRIMTFEDCMIECIKQSNLIHEFDRLTGCHLVRIFHDTRKPIERMIDEATGYDKELEGEKHEDLQAFISFCYEFIWSPLLCNLIRETEIDKIVGILKWRIKHE